MLISLCPILEEFPYTVLVNQIVLVRLSIKFDLFEFS